MSLPGRPKGRPALRVTSCMCLSCLGLARYSNLDLEAKRPRKWIRNRNTVSIKCGNTDREAHTVSIKYGNTDREALTRSKMLPYAQSKIISKKKMCKTSCNSLVYIFACTS